MAEPLSANEIVRGCEELVVECGLAESFELPGDLGERVCVGEVLDQLISLDSPEMQDEDRQAIKRGLVIAIWRGASQSAARRFVDGV